MFNRMKYFLEGAGYRSFFYIPLILFYISEKPPVFQCVIYILSMHDQKKQKK